MKKINLRSTVFFISLITAIAFISCGGPKEAEEKVTVLSKITLNAEDSVNFIGKTEGDAHSGKYFSRTDSAVFYGMGANFQLNDSLIGSDIRVCIDMWVRASNAIGKQCFAISLNEGQKIVNWSEIYFTKDIISFNTWFNVKDSITISGDVINKPGLLIGGFTFCPDGKSVLDVDDIVITFKSIQKPLVK